MRGIILLSLLLFLLLGNPVIAEQSIEEIVRQGVSQAQGSASSEDSGKSVPNYSKEKATEEGEKLSNIDDGELKSKANEKMLSAEADTAEGITRDAMNKKPLDGFEKHEMFKKADEIWKDPLSEMEKITAKDCKERVNEQKNQYTKKTTKEKQYDTELYEESCEKPAGKIICENTLNINCAKEEILGGVINWQVPNDVTLEHKDNVLKVGMENLKPYGYLSVKPNSSRCESASRDGYYLSGCEYISVPKYCGTHDRLIQFNLDDSKRVLKFVLRRAEFRSYLWLKVNGTTIYTAPERGSGFEEWDDKKVKMPGRDPYSRGVGNDWWINECERNTNFNNELNIDLKPYLRSGQNTIWMRVIVGHGGGHARLTIDVNQKKICPNWKETWEKRCWQN